MCPLPTPSRDVSVPRVCDGVEACPVYRCIFVDVRGQQHNVRVSSAHDELVAFAAHDMRAPLATCKPKK